MIVKLTDRCYELVSPKTKPSGNLKYPTPIILLKVSVINISL